MTPRHAAAVALLERCVRRYGFGAMQTDAVPAKQARGYSRDFDLISRHGVDLHVEYFDKTFIRVTWIDSPTASLPSEGDRVFASEERFLEFVEALSEERYSDALRVPVKEPKLDTRTEDGSPLSP
jgi:hypothetical protein